MSQRSRVVIPPWVLRADNALAHAVVQVRLVSSITPKNFCDELDRACEALRRDHSFEPAFSYGPVDERLADLAAALCHLADGLLDSGGHRDDNEWSLARLYALRARELATEAELCLAVPRGAAAVREVAARRFDPCPDSLAQASALAEQWLGERASPVDGSLVSTDNEADERSLVWQLRSTVSRLRVPCRIAVHPSLASLAATGEDTIWVAAGRRLTAGDVERTVLHEVFGHLMPRERAKAAPLGILRVGSAGGSDEQEGYALTLEHEAGFLPTGAPRRRRLALRHIAATMARAGASLPEVFERLRDVEAPAQDRAVAALRAFRAGGAAREIVYLPAFLRVRRRLAEDPDARAWLSAGSVGLDAIGPLRDVFGPAPPWLPERATYGTALD